MNKRIKILAVLPGIAPSTTILVIEPLMHLLDLEEIELRLRLEQLDASFSDLNWADLVIFCRNTEPARDFVARLLSLSKPYIYELDDNFFELPLNTPEGLYHRAPERMAQLEKYIKHASLVRVYSLPLELRVRHYTPSVKLVKAPVNLRSIPSLPPPHRSEKLKIVFSTSRMISDNLSQIFIKDLTRIIKENGAGIEIHFWGFHPEELKGLPSVKFHRFVPNYQKYMQAIYKEGFDIGLAPMKNDLFHNSKTNNKFREYGACWIAGIYSNTDVYSNCIVDGHTGLLVSNEDTSWYNAITRLMRDSSLRKNIQNQARSFIEQEYSQDTFALLLLNDMDQILSDSLKLIPPETSFIHKRNKLGISQRLTIIPARILKYSASAFHKIYRSIRKYGLAITSRLFLNQIGQYIAFFELSRQIRQKKT